MQRMVLLFSQRPYFPRFTHFPQSQPFPNMNLNHTNLNPPFTRDLAIDMQAIRSAMAARPSGSLNHVPDQPSVGLQADAVRNFLQKELETPALDRIYKWLWFCAAKESQHIDPLHRQVFKGRAIILMEDPALHLIWFRENICIKPIPLALLNHDFWALYLNGRKDQFDRRVVLGFLRSYRYLVQHPSDFKIATDRGLIPLTTTWLQWMRFIDNFGSLSDADVANRYHFGQIRLSRLNILNFFLRPRRSNETGNNRHYYTTHWHTSAYLRQSVGPGLYIFASVSLLLSAMQVILSLPTEIQTRTRVKETASLSLAFWGFCGMVLVLLAFLWLLLIGGTCFYMAAQQVFGYSRKRDFDRRCIRSSKSSPSWILIVAIYVCNHTLGDP